MKKHPLKLLIILLIILLYSSPVYANDVVVVLDPGHGGDSLGGHNDMFQEMYLNMEVAKYAKERLEQYEGVVVYLTRDNAESENTTLKERAEFAAAHNADFLFSIHFNMSEKHKLYGAEVWTSAFGEYYSKGQEFGHIEMDALVNETGFYDRGVKTKVSNKDKNTDYYGSIREARELGIPCVIIEHCHMDEERDYNYLLEHSDAYKTLGYLDADAIAKYYRLSSASLGVDYSNYDRETFPAPEGPVYTDKTAPTYCSVTLDEVDTENNTATITVNSHDDESYLIYYQISTDEGENFGRLFPWNNDPNAKKSSKTDSITVTVPLKEGEESSIVVRAQNLVDQYADSEVLKLPAGSITETEEESSTDSEYNSLSDSSVMDETEYEEIEYEWDDSVKRKNIVDSDDLLLFVIAAIGLLLIICMTALIFAGKIRKNKRKRSRNRRQQK